MNTAQAAQLLAMAAAYDNRNASEIAARAWGEALHDIRFDDARHALIEHYKHNRQWLMPADIREGVQALRYHRTLRGRIHVGHPPADLEPDAHTEFLRISDRLLGDGLTPDEAGAKAYRAALDYQKQIQA